MLRSGYVRLVTLHARARLAIASIESNPSLRSARIAEARRAARKLRKEGSPWAALLAAMVDAMVENVSGRREGAIVALRESAERAESTATLCFLPAIRHRLGELTGGDEGRALVESAIEAIAAQGVRRPARWVVVHLPGQWGATSSR